MKKLFCAGLLVLSASLSRSAFATSPIVDIRTVLNARFYDATGGLWMSDFVIVFGPPPTAKVDAVVRTAKGDEILRHPMRIEKYADHQVFDGLVSQGAPTAMIGKAGSFILSFELDGKSITELPFTLKEEKSSDPFNPKSKWSAEGPWKELGYLSQDPERADQGMYFNFWTKLGDFGKTKGRGKVTVHVLRGKSEVANCRPIVVAQTSYGLRRARLLQAKKKNQFFTQSVLKDGSYTIQLKADGKRYRSFPLQVKGKKPVPHKRSAITDTLPKNFLSPKILSQGKGSGDRKLLEAFWVSAK